MEGRICGGNWRQWHRWPHPRHQLTTRKRHQCQYSHHNPPRSKFDWQIDRRFSSSICSDSATLIEWKKSLISRRQSPPLPNKNESRNWYHVHAQRTQASIQPPSHTLWGRKTHYQPGIYKEDLDGFKYTVNIFLFPDIYLYTGSEAMRGRP